MWIIDFDEMPITEAEKYTLPFAYVEEEVKPKRESGRDTASKEKWWLHQRSRPDMRGALQGKTRYIATTRHSRHRMFVWLPIKVLPDSALVAIAADDDYRFGVLQSSVHVMWALRQGTYLGQGNDPRYTPTTCFETFPFPKPLEGQRARIAEWAVNVVETREHLMASDNTLTLTKLYSALEELQAVRNTGHRTYPLLLAHEKLDEAVVAAYGWEWPMAEEEILKQLLTLNLAKAAEEEGSETRGTA